MNNEIKDEITNLCFLALQTRNRFKNGNDDDYRILSTEKFETSDLIYKHALTLHHMQELGIISLLQLQHIDVPQEMSTNTFSAEFNYQKAEEWIKNLEKEKSEESIISFPKGKDFTYINEKLYLKQLDGYPVVWDLSRSDELRPIFESFYEAFIETGELHPDSTTIVKKYNKKTGRKWEWSKIIWKKSGSFNSAKTNELLKKRIVWEHDRKVNKHRFEIKPLISRITTSDSPTIKI